MKEKLEQIRMAAKEQDLTPLTPTLRRSRIRFLGKKGELTSVLRGMGALSAEERPKVGQLANEVREYIENAIAEKAEAQKKEALAEEAEGGAARRDDARKDPGYRQASPARSGAEGDGGHLRRHGLRHRR